jgi:glucokinase
MSNIIGIDIGGTKCAVILGSIMTDKKPDILDKVMFPTESSRGVTYTLEQIFTIVEQILIKNKLKITDINGFGISCGGPLDSKKGIIMSPPNLVGWDNINIVEIIEQRFGVKTRLQNDANACALAEWRFGAGRGSHNMIFLTFGTGMGAGLILNDRLYCGTSDMAGEVGHIRLANFGPVGYGKAGSFEGLCSGGGLAQLARMKVLEKLQMGEKVSFCAGVHELEHLNAKIVSEAAKAGDELALEIFKICGLSLGQGLAILMDILNPEVIIIGSIFARCQELFTEPMMGVIHRETLSLTQKVCRIVPAGLGEQIGDYAALAVAMDDGSERYGSDGYEK